MGSVVATCGTVMVLASLGIAGCNESSKVSERKASAHAERLSKLVDDDVEEVRRGLPRGAKALGKIWEGHADPHADPGSVRRALDRVRSEDRDLEVCKSTFFAITDDKGMVLRSDQEPEQLAGKNLLAAFPTLIKVLSGEGVEAVGAIPELAGARTGSDVQWLAAAPVRDVSGVVRGIYVSGWSLRRFAFHLEETLRHELIEEALKAGESRMKLPLIYVFAFLEDKAYGAPVTPIVNTDAIEALDVGAKTEAGVFHRFIEITGRPMQCGQTQHEARPGGRRCRAALGVVTTTPSLRKRSPCAAKRPRARRGCVATSSFASS